MKTSIIWDKFQIEGKKIVTSGEIEESTDKLSKDKDKAIDYLQQNGYIVRLLKGIFYVKSHEERNMKKYDKSRYEMVAMALERKGVKAWYYGLETALKFNNMTHEYFTIDYVITDSYRTTKVIKILDYKYKFLKRDKKYFKKGIVKKGDIRYSDRERTILDLAYKRYRNKEGSYGARAIINEYYSQLDRDKYDEYLKIYPIRFQKALEGKS